MRKTSAPFDLPANAPRVCPACSGEWTFGYIVKKERGSSGAGRPKAIYKWALECRNPGCGLGYFVGSEIERKEAKGLARIDRAKRRQEAVRMAEENEGQDARVHKSWSGTYKKCRDCGTTERPCVGRGLCSACYARHRNEGTLDRYPPIAPEKAPKKGKARRPAKRRPAKTGSRAGGERVEVNVAVNYHDLPPKVQSEIKERAAAIIAEKALARL